MFFNFTPGAYPGQRTGFDAAFVLRQRRRAFLVTYVKERASERQLMRRQKALTMSVLFFSFFFFFSLFFLFFFPAFGLRRAANSPLAGLLGHPVFMQIRQVVQNNPAVSPTASTILSLSLSLSLSRLVVNRSSLLP